MIAKAVIRHGRSGFPGLIDQAGSKLQGAAGVGKADVFEIHVLQTFEIAFGNVEDGLGEDELAFAKVLLPGDGPQEFRVARLDKLFRAAGGVGLKAAAPIKLNRPAFDGDEGGADLADNGGVAAAWAEFEVSAEGREGAGGFAGGGG